MKIRSLKHELSIIQYRSLEAVQDSINNFNWEKFWGHDRMDDTYHFIYNNVTIIVINGLLENIP